MMRPRIAVVVSGFPRRSETFALHELAALAERDMLAGIFATRPGETETCQPQAVALLPRVTWLPAGSAEDQAQAMADALRGTRVDGVHGYFAHRPGAVARAVADQLGVPFTMSVHARDVRKVRDVILAERVRRARLVLACNMDVARDIRRVDGNPLLVPHGVDLDRFHPATTVRGKTLQVLAVGRLVEKKGFADLIDALALVCIPVELTIVGDGPLRSALAAQCRARGVEDRVHFRGVLTHDALPAVYARADVVAIPSVIDAAGDRDGLPNVLLEAMASGRPVVATRVGAIPSAFTGPAPGVLVDPHRPDRLAAGIATMTDPEQRYRSGRNARRHVAKHYGLEQMTAQFCDTLEAALV